MRVHIIGPNLQDQSKGGMHVHKAGCADTRKTEYRLHADDIVNTYDVESMADITTAVYDPSDFEYDASNDRELNDYLADIWVAPCVKLPYRV